MGLDAFDKFLAGVDIDSGLAIGYRGSLGHRVLYGGWAGRLGRRGRSASCGILHQATKGFRDNTMAPYRSENFRRFLHLAGILCLSVAALGFGTEVEALTRAELFKRWRPPGTAPGRDDRGLPNRHEAVLVRVTGRRSAEDDPALAPMVANARRYVQQYRGGADK